MLPVCSVNSNEGTASVVRDNNHVYTGLPLGITKTAYLLVLCTVLRLT